MTSLTACFTGIAVAINFTRLPLTNLLNLDGAQRSSGFLAIIKRYGLFSDNLIRFMALAGYQYDIPRAGYRNSHFNGTPAVRFNDISFIFKPELDVLG